MTARADYFPQLSNETSLFGAVGPGVGDGALRRAGDGSGAGTVPYQTITFDQGSNTLLLANTTLGQPLTQLFKIRQGVRVAAADQRISEAELKKAEDEVVLGVHQLYYGLLAAS